MTNTLDIRAENRIVSDWLLHYPERLQRHLDQQERVPFYAGQAMSDDIRAKGGTSDPTARIAEARLKYDSEWFALIELVEQSLPQKQRVFLECRREATHQRGGKPGRPAWVAYVQCRYPLVMAELTGKDVERFYIGREMTLVSWWERIVEYAARMAAKRGLL